MSSINTESNVSNLTPINSLTETNHTSQRQILNTITQNDISALHDIKQFIDINSDTVHHVALLKLIHSSQPDILNENNNGTFVNLKSATKELIITLSEYIVQIHDQSKILDAIASEQSTITSTYFG
jgi:hypothetical protein